MGKALLQHTRWDSDHTSRSLPPSMIHGAAAWEKFYSVTAYPLGIRIR